MIDPSQDLTAGLDVELKNLQSSTLSSLVSYFRTTPTGQQMESQYKQQVLSEYLNNPVVWIAGILIIILFVVK